MKITDDTGWLQANNDDLAGFLRLRGDAAVGVHTFQFSGMAFEVTLTPADGDRLVLDLLPGDGARDGTGCSGTLECEEAAWTLIHQADVSDSLELSLFELDAGRVTCEDPRGRGGNKTRLAVKTPGGRRYLELLKKQLIGFYDQRYDSRMTADRPDELRFMRTKQKMMSLSLITIDPSNYHKYESYPATKAVQCNTSHTKLPASLFHLFQHKTFLPRQGRARFCDVWTRDVDQLTAAGGVGVSAASSGRSARSGCVEGWWLHLNEGNFGICP